MRSAELLQKLRRDIIELAAEVDAQVAGDKDREPITLVGLFESLDELGAIIARRDAAATEDPIIVEADGSQWMVDDQGRRVPLAVVKPQDKLRDELVRKLFSYAEPLSAQISRFFAHTMFDIDTFDQLLAQEYGLVPRGRKGNRRYLSFDGTRMVQVAVAEKITFGPELQVAKGLIDEWLLANMDGASDELRAFVTRAFAVDKEGRVNQHELLRLRRLEITGQIWSEAMRAIADAIRPQGTKQYVRFYRRPTAEARWTAVTIDLAQV